MTRTRRQFLKSAVAAPAVLGIGTLAPQFLRQAVGAESKTNDDRILVVVQLSGGNDGLNTVVPHSDPTYRKQRPKLAIPKSDVLSINGTLGFHPAARGLADLLEEDRLAIIQGVGFPNPNRSHFEAMDIWHTCLRKDEPRDAGWLGRYFDAHRATDTAGVPGVHLGGEKQPLALRAQHVRVPTVESLDQFRLQLKEQQSPAAVRQLVNAERSDEGDLLGFVQTSTTSALDVSERFQLADKSHTPREAYPQTDLGQKMRTISQLILSELPTRVYYVEIDGFDTHSQQGAAHAGLLRRVGDAVHAFVSDMVEQGQADRVLVMCFSEFGRRVAENASEGTDHGAAAPMFLAGSRVKPGLIGRHPKLTDLDETGDIKHHTDFRQVYATVLEEWLGSDSRTILGGRFDPVDAIAS